MKVEKRLTALEEKRITTNTTRRLALFKRAKAGSLSEPFEAQHSGEHNDRIRAALTIDKCSGSKDNGAQRKRDTSDQRRNKWPLKTMVLRAAGGRIPTIAVVVARIGRRRRRREGTIPSDRKVGPFCSPWSSSSYSKYYAKGGGHEDTVLRPTIDGRPQATGRET